MNAVMEEKKPFIHLMKNALGYYIYDVNKNGIVKISKDVYDFLNGERIDPGRNEFVLHYIDELKKEGYFRSNRVEIAEHQLTEVLEDFLNNKMAHITLQVTQNCNLKCGYCAYSGGYHQRIHTNKRMSFETAKKAIDFLISHSKDLQADRLALSFYGGEPLLEFEMIKSCVSYAEKQAEGREIRFNFTTNGTLLTEEKMEFFNSA